ncbi:MAG TPA: hypothetical protein VFH58_08710 [Acidimicrobiales bacterium]|nr:hypothetical protein [Acidimicrobiales bacterium]
MPTTSTSTNRLTTTTIEEDDLGGPGAPTIAGSVVTAGAGTSSGSAACRSGSPLANVYHPNRLTVVNACMTVSGTVESVRSESDGDTHFDLALDPQFSSLLRPANSSGQHGWLVAEIVPADEPGCIPGQPPRPATGTYDYGICTGADETVPAVGTHVYVTGPYVLDEDHGGWAEIHPVWAVSSHGPASAPPSFQAADATTTTRPATPPPSTATGVQIESVTSPVSRGSEVSLVAQTSPNMACNLEVTLPSGGQSQSQGLGPRSADNSGRVQWNWQTGTRTKPGTATANVTCGSASESAQFQITN